jgi:hypothetical protein
MRNSVTRILIGFGANSSTWVFCTTAIAESISGQQEHFINIPRANRTQVFFNLLPVEPAASGCGLGPIHFPETI